MKKVLFTTTALVAAAGFAGMAAAEVSLSGGAEMGLVGGDGNVGQTGADPQFHTAIDDISFTMSGATDNGLTFGASVDFSDAASDNVGANTVIQDETNGTAAAFDDRDLNGDGDTTDTAVSIVTGVTSSNGVFNNTTQGGESIFLSGAFGTINAGDVDGAFDARLQEVDVGPGAIADDHTAHAGFSGNGGLDGLFDGQIVRYDYTFGALTVSASAELDDADVTGSDASNVYGLGASYNTQMSGINWGFGVGFQTGTPADGTGNDFDTRVNLSSDWTVYGFSASAGFANGFEAVVNYSEFDVDDFGVAAGVPDNHWGIAGAYTVGAISVGANYGEFSMTGPNNDQSGFGVAAGYELGGGANLLFGYGNSDFDNPAVNDTDSYSLGMSFSF